MKDLNTILNTLAKWRAHFAGWQLGTRPSEDPECQAVRDHREATLILRAEVNALIGLLVKKRVFSQDEFNEALADSAEKFNSALEQKFPGVTASMTGLHYDRRAIEHMKHWKP
jgi:hypothetical protein